MKYVLAVITIATLVAFAGASYAGPHDRHNKNHWRNNHHNHHLHSRTYYDFPKYKHSRWDRWDHRNRWNRWDRPRSSFSLNIYSAPSRIVHVPVVTRALEYSDPYVPVVWRDNNQTYNVIPGNVYTSNDGRYCREYQSRITVGSRTQEGYGNACRQPDGSWEILD